MSALVPFTTQVGPSHGATTQASTSQLNLKIVLVYNDKITERQSALMKECQEYLYQYLGIVVAQSSELESLSSQMRFFVIPSPKEELIRRIRAYFDNSLIYLPRAVIEARGYYRVNLPVRRLAISLTMHNCRIFLVQSCNHSSIRNKINEMSGQVVSNFSSDEVNIVITDCADNKYCSKAFNRRLAVVSRAWVDDSYKQAMEEDPQLFNHDALTSAKDYQIKPFFGLYFKLMKSSPEIKRLIVENQGHIVYGKENCLTHIVVPEMNVDSMDGPPAEGTLQVKKPPKVVCERFLKACASHGYYLTKREFKELDTMSMIDSVKPPGGRNNDFIPDDEHIVVEIDDDDDINTPPLDSVAPCESATAAATNENAHMLPPPVTATRVHKQPESNMDDIIWKAMSTFEAPQTQQASTQMRRLPDAELRIEQTYEPTQQLYWKDRT